jgi:hypothetical protein
MPHVWFAHRHLVISARRVALLALALATTACFSHRATAPSQTPSGTVRVTFASPRTVSVSRTSGEVFSVPRSTEVEGRVDRVGGDTVYLRVHRVRGPQGEAKGVPMNGIAAIVRDADTVVERRAYNNDRTLGFILGGLAVGFLAVLAVQGKPDVVYGF